MPSIKILNLIGTWLVMNKKIVFLTGTRADFGKLKPLIKKVEKSEIFDCYIFVTGMHTLSKYGSTYLEIQKENYKNIFVYMNQSNTTDSDIILANTVTGFSNFVKEVEPDLIVIHGDRLESLAGAIVGSFNNILVSHIEGGEVSGTLDEMIRHSVTKLSHIHFVSNEQAKKRLLQMGEEPDSIFVIGSPDIDVMTSDTLPTIDTVKKHYDILFDEYSILIFHPVTTEFENLEIQINEIVSAVIESNQNFVIIYPNNDKGNEIILNEYKRLKFNPNFKIFPSIRFEYFLRLLQNSDLILGNSSVGIRESEIYGIPSINLGSRQNDRSNNKNIVNVEPEKTLILDSINKSLGQKIPTTYEFGKGNSSEKFYDIISSHKIWRTHLQKYFKDFKS